MDHTPISPAPEQPSHLSTFFKGMRSGAFSSALMLGIFSLVALVPVFHVIAFASLWAPAAILLTTSLFSGVMAVKRSIEHEAHGGAVVPVITGHSPGMATGHVLQPAMEIADAAETERSSNWTERTGRSTDSQSRVKEILANGSLSDKDRAREILAARENAAGNGASI